MRSIQYQANVRDRFPVNGCVAVIRQLYYQIQFLGEEFHALLTQLEMYRQQHQISSDVISQLEPPTSALQVAQPYTLQHFYSSYMDYPKDDISLWILDANNHSSANNDGQLLPLVPNSEPLAEAEAEDQAQHQAVQDSDEIHPLFDSTR
ncbi:hypothetical protein V6N11_051694 [Hibiscus sabdariffa]|uniref:LOB domain-containing protein n=1 Tax=Hibiscus sabdariffa TaxID=183260 RepID=A0ABR2U893_9ROSI